MKSIERWLKHSPETFAEREELRGSMRSRSLDLKPASNPEVMAVPLRRGGLNHPARLARVKSSTRGRVLRSIAITVNSNVRVAMTPNNVPKALR